jgi:hypothetical protein
MNEILISKLQTCLHYRVDSGYMEKDILAICRNSITPNLSIEQVKSAIHYGIIPEATPTPTPQVVTIVQETLNPELKSQIDNLIKYMNISNTSNVTLSYDESIAQLQNLLNGVGEVVDIKEQLKNDNQQLTSILTLVNSKINYMLYAAAYHKFTSYHDHLLNIIAQNGGLFEEPHTQAFLNCVELMVSHFKDIQSALHTTSENDPQTDFNNFDPVNEYRDCLYHQPQDWYWPEIFLNAVATTL